MTASEHLIAAGQALWHHLTALTPLAAALNAGLSLIVVALAWLAAAGLNWLPCYGASRIPGSQESPARQHAERAMRSTRSLLGVVAGVAAALLIANIWSFDLFSWASQGVGERVSRTLLAIFIVTAATAVAFETAGVFVTYLLGRVKRRKGDSRRAAQFETLGPIMRRTLQTIILVIGIMTFLSQLGVQIAPLLAGAGVVGIAVGFGAQTLVKDFFTGFFLLIEDVVAVSDVITINSSSGTVENMTLRYISLRDFDGTLHVFPYGEAQIIHNMTKTFAFAAFDLPVAIDSDVDHVMAVIRQTGAAMVEDTAFRGLILEPIDVVGIEYMTDFGIVIRSRIKTLPQERWKVSREFHRRIKPAFDAAGIVVGHKGAYAPS